MNRTAKRVFSFVLSFVLCISMFAGVTIVKPKNNFSGRHSLIIIAYADAEEAETPAQESNDTPSSGDNMPADTVTTTVETPTVVDVPGTSETPPAAEAGSTVPEPAGDTPSTNEVVSAAPVAAADNVPAVIEEVKSDAPAAEVKEAAVDTKDGTTEKTEESSAVDKGKDDKTAAVAEEIENEQDPAKTESAAKSGPNAEDDVNKDVNKADDETKEEEKTDTTKEGGAKNVSFTAIEVKEEVKAEAANIEENTKKVAAADAADEKEDEETEGKTEDSTTPVAEDNEKKEPIPEPIIKLSKNANRTQSEPTRGQSLEDIIPPELLDIILSKATLTAGGQDHIVVDVYATDDVSGIGDEHTPYSSSSYVTFTNKETEKSITAVLYNDKMLIIGDDGYSTGDTMDVPAGVLEGWLTAASSMPTGKYEFSSITISDKAGNRAYFHNNDWENTIPDSLKNLYVNVVNNNTADLLPPTLLNLTLSKTTLTAGEKDYIVVDVYAKDDVSGIGDEHTPYSSSSYVTFTNKETEKSITAVLYNDKMLIIGDDGYSTGETMDVPAGVLEGWLTANKYLPSGIYELSNITISDKAGNRAYFHNNDWENTIPESLKNLAINVINNGTPDLLPPSLLDLRLSKTTLETGGKDHIIVDVYAKDDVSGIGDEHTPYSSSSYVTFTNKETEKSITAVLYNDKMLIIGDDGYSTGETMNIPSGVLEGWLTANPYMPAGKYVLSSITISDQAGNRAYFHNNDWENTIPDSLRNLFIMVINNGYYPPVVAPTGYTVTDYIPEVPSQGDVTTDSISTVPGYDVDISKSETYEQLKNELLTTEERLQVARGKDVKITLEFNLPEVAASDVKLVENAVGSGTIATWLDISVFKQIEGFEKIKVDKPNGKVKLQITAPDEIIALAAAGVPFELIRIVDGEIVRIPATYNAKTNTIDFETDSFGVFALVYNA